MTKRHLVYKGTPLCTNIIIAYLSKKDELKAYNGKFKIEVDGGINDETIKNVTSCDMVVVGSYITNGDYETQIKKIKNNF